jgi:uncharacterized UPF0160 family protein
MNLVYLRTFIKEKIQQYPNLKEEILDLFSLCLDEIDEGGSEQSEVDSCISDINDLIEENKIN